MTSGTTFSGHFRRVSCDRRFGWLLWSRGFGGENDSSRVRARRGLVSLVRGEWRDGFRRRLALRHFVMASWMVGIDTGGTFTDLIAFHAESGERRVAKVPSVPSDPPLAVVRTIF